MKNQLNRFPQKLPRTMLMGAFFGICAAPMNDLFVTPFLRQHCIPLILFTVVTPGGDSCDPIDNPRATKELPASTHE